MYYCIRCNQVHHEKMKAEKVFNSGYTLIHSHKVPLGLCAKGNSSQEECPLALNDLSERADVCLT